MQETGASTAVNTTPAIGRCTSCDRRNTNRSTSATMQITNASAMRSAGDGKIRSAIKSTTAGTATRAMATSGVMGMDMDTTSTTTIDMTRRFRIAGSGLALASALLLTPVLLTPVIAAET